MKKICSVCNGNGFVQSSIMQKQERNNGQIVNFCNNQGEIEVEEEDDDTIREMEH